MHKKICLSLLGIAVCLLTSCVESEHPLSDPVKSEADMDLVGTWSRSEGDEKQILHIGRETEKSQLIDRNRLEVEPGLMGMHPVMHKSDGVIRKDPPLYFFATKLANGNFFNLLMADEKEKTFGGYLVMKYEVKGDQLTIWDCQEEPTAAAISAGKIKGTVERNNDRKIKKVRLTDTTPNLAAFFASDAANDCFADKDAGGNDRRVIYTRVK